MGQNRLREIRNKRNVSQKEIANKIGVSQELFSRWERNNRLEYVKLSWLIKICEALSCKLSDLLPEYQQYM